MKWNTVTFTILLGALLAPKPTHGISVTLARAAAQAAAQVGRVAAEAAPKAAETLAEAGPEAVKLGAQAAIAAAKKAFQGVAALCAAGLSTAGVTFYDRAATTAASTVPTSSPTIPTGPGWLGVPSFIKAIPGYAKQVPGYTWQHSGAILWQGAKAHPILATTIGAIALYGTYKIIKGNNLAALVRTHRNQPQFDMRDPDVQRAAVRAQVPWYFGGPLLSLIGFFIRW